jgi:Rrf2 family nitric oxide-sensitive transcriptional repressor
LLEETAHLDSSARLKTYFEYQFKDWSVKSVLMKLTLFSDYSLRVVLYLASNGDRLVTLSEMSRAYRISHHHLVKVVQRLNDEGFVESTRGRGGGCRLARLAREINIGALVRLTEPGLELVECFDPDTNTCPIDPACGLKPVLEHAQAAFLEVLDRHTVEDFLPKAPALLKLWKRELARA